MSTTKQKTIKLSSIKPNPDNPRLIKDDKFYKLVESIKTFGEKMMPIRPIVIDENKIILGGNMRFKALKELGYKEVPASWVKSANDLTEAQKKEFIIKDNVGFGSWDFDSLANDWDGVLLEEWGLDMPIFEDNLSNNENYIGMNPELELNNFMNSEIKRLYLVYDSETFENVVEWLDNKINNLGLNNYSEYILKLMENEKN